MISIPEFITCGFVGDGPTYQCLLCGRLGTDHPSVLRSLLSAAVTAEKTDFDLPQDWVHRASAATGAAVGSEFVPKRATSSEVHRMRAALTLVHDEFVRWDILPADKCRQLRKQLRQLLAETSRD